MNSLTKPKRKAIPENPIKYFFNEFVFLRREFSFVLACPPETIVAKLSALHRERSTFLGGGWRINPSLRETPEGWQFDIKIEELSKKNYMRKIIADGTIERDNDGVLYLTGKIRINALACLPVTIYLAIALLFLITFLVVASQSNFILAFTNGGAGSLTLVVFGGLSLWFLFRLISDRLHLFNIIEAAVKSANDSIDDKTKAS